MDNKTPLCGIREACSSRRRKAEGASRRVGRRTGCFGLTGRPCRGKGSVLDSAGGTRELLKTRLWSATMFFFLFGVQLLGSLLPLSLSLTVSLSSHVHTLLATRHPEELHPSSLFLTTLFLPAFVPRLQGCQCARAQNGRRQTIPRLK